MEHVLDFVFAAMPWITVGLLLAIYASRSAAKKKEHADNYGTEGMCVGMCFGTAIDATLGGFMGMLIGLAIGSCIGKKVNGNEEKQPVSFHRRKG